MSTWCGHTGLKPEFVTEGVGGRDTSVNRAHCPGRPLASWSGHSGDEACLSSSVAWHKLFHLSRVSSSGNGVIVATIIRWLSG